MEKRNYPIERKPGPLWECPICRKSMSARGKAGHMEKVHRRGKPLKEHDPFPWIHRELVKKRRPLSKIDVRDLVDDIFCLLIDATKNKNPNNIRKAMFQCEYLIWEVEIKYNCTLEEACRKFPQTGPYKK